MPLVQYDPTNDNNGDGKYVRKIFRNDPQGMQIKSIGAKEGTRFILLPAHVERFTDVKDPSAVNPQSFVSYRTSNGDFSAWKIGFRYYDFLGPERNHFLVSPKMFDPKALDAVDILWQTVKSSPDFYELGALGADGKKDDKDDTAFRRAIIGPSKDGHAVNALEVENDGQLSGNLILTLTATALGKRDNDQHGLLGKLNKKLPSNYRKSVEVQQPDGSYVNDWTNLYEFGDPTNPDEAMTIEIFKEKPASGGKAIFNSRFIVDKRENDRPVTSIVPDEALEGRWFLADIFEYTEPTELLDMMFELFRAHPKLLRRAFQNHVAGVDNKLKQMGIISDDVVRQVGGRRDERETTEMGAASSAPAPARSRFTDRRESSTAVQTTAQNDVEDTGDEIPGLPTSRGNGGQAAAAPTTPTRVPATPPSRFAPRSAAAPGSTMATATTAAGPITKPAPFAPRAARPGAGGIEVEQKPRNDAQVDQDAEALLAQLDAQESGS